MPNKEFPTDYTAASTLDGDELVLLDQSGTKKAKAKSIAGARWERQGVVLEPEDGVDVAGIQEISVIYEGSPQVLADTGVSVFKAWYTGGFGGTRGLCYAESYDGLIWERKKTAGATIYVLNDLIHASVVKDGSTYYAFGADSGSLTIEVYSSADGITWSLVKADAVPRPGTGWNATYYGNIFAWKEGSTWYIMVEAIGDVSGQGWALGLFTATSLAGTWTAYASNPVLVGSDDGGMVGGPFITKVGSRYWMWLHQNSGPATPTFPTDIYRYYSDDLHTWTRSPADRPVLRRNDSDGSQSNSGQVADAWLVEADGRTFMYYEGTGHGGNLYNTFFGKLAIYEGTIADLVASEEYSDGFEPFRRGQTGNRVQITAFLAASTTVNNGVISYLAFTASSLRGSNGSSLTDNFFNAGGTTWTAPRNGWYEVSLLINITSLSTTGINVVLGITDNDGNYRNGGAFVQTFPTSTETPSMQVTVKEFFYRGDVCKFRAYPTGGNITVSNSNLGTVLTIEEKPMP